jgi:RimJ/RimL family protein N-acetyltransferase
LNSERVVADILRGRWFSLVPLNPSHHGSLYELGFRDQNNFRWRFRGAVPPFTAFEQSLFAGVLCQFAVCPNDKSDQVAGLVVAYNASPQDDFCYLAVITDRRFGSGTIEAIALFLRYLFRHWPMRKVYLESLEFNADQYSSAVKFGLFKEEGRLKAHHFFDGKYWDLITYAMYREDAIEFADQRPTIFESDPLEAIPQD